MYKQKIGNPRAQPVRGRRLADGDHLYAGHREHPGRPGGRPPGAPVPHLHGPLEL